MINNPLFLDIHVLQTVPPSCINRDDTGSPKTARFGGVRRARVSSQAWKKAMRDEFAHLLDEDEVGSRTKDAVGLIAENIKTIDNEVSDDDALKMAADALGATGVKVKDNATGYLLFISPRQAHALADLAHAAQEQGGKIDAKAAKGVLNPKERPTLNAVDIALFGRMVADSADLNVDASAQVAHAIGISASEPEFDYFTAMDDRSPEDTAGAGMIGTVEFTSSTLYRYATVDVRHLAENLGSMKATIKAVGAFLQAFVVSMPTGKQNTFANRTLPSAVIIQLRDTQPISLVNAFELPIYAGGGKSQSRVACERLVKQEKGIEQAFGMAPQETYVICSNDDEAEALSELAEPMSLHDSIECVEERVAHYLASIGMAADGRE